MNGPLTGIINMPSMALSMLFILVVGSSIAVITSKHFTRSYYAELKSLEQRRDDLQVEWSKLLLEKTTWAGDARVERLAREQLGMKQPQHKHILVIK